MGGNAGSVSRGVWMTPNVPNGGRHIPESLVNSKGMTEDGQKRTVGLESQSKYWATQDCNSSSYSNGRFGQNIREQAQSWATPRATDGEKGGPNCRGGRGDPILAGHVCQWPTQTSRDHKGGGKQVTRQDGKSRMDMLDWRAEAFSLPARQTGVGNQSSIENQPSPRRLNPIFVEWLMGWRSQWTNPEPHACGAAETALWRSKLQQHLSCLLDEQEFFEKDAA